MIFKIKFQRPTEINITFQIIIKKMLLFVSISEEGKHSNSNQ